MEFSSVLFLAGVFLLPSTLFLLTRGLWRRLSVSWRCRLGRVLHAFACLYLPVLGWYYAELLWGPSFEADGEVAHFFSSLSLSFLIYSLLAVIGTPPLLWLGRLLGELFGGLRRRSAPD